MNIPTEIIINKDLNPLQKLMLGLILDVHPTVLQIGGGYDKTCGEMANELGTTRTKVKEALEDLVGRGYLTTEKSLAWRRTNLTEKLKNITYR